MAKAQENLGEVRPWPVVDWRQILVASDPAAAVTQQRLRTLRGRAVLSEGIQRSVSSNGRLVGKVSLFCELNIEAVVLARRGLAAVASSYRSAASLIERALSAQLDRQEVHAADLLGPAAQSSPVVLEMLRTLSSECASVRAKLPGIPGEETATGILTLQEESWVQFTPSEHLHLQQLLPIEMALGVGLSVGDPAVLTREVLSNGTVLLRMRPGLLFSTGSALA
ncbi:hypothetical protein ACF08W_12360 [Streptomyces sp. NPDC015144]|uniref:hypothetical protein n=1 Tax=Streptomyces sp. NPDC015144 TaxID=3364944 RepID=UPI0036F66B84